MKLLDTTPHLYEPKRADYIAAEMTRNDLDGWTYTADHDPNGAGYSRVEIRDENGEFVSYL